MVGDWILNDFEELLLRAYGSDRQSVKQLDHKTCESLEGSWDTNGWTNFDEDAICGMDVDLQFTGLVNGRVEESEEALCAG